jgi:hypothetical protein
LAGSLRPHQCGCNNSNLSEKDYLVLPTKGGLIYRFNLTDVDTGPTTMTLEYFKFIGNPGLLGGSNFGSASNNVPRIYPRCGNSSMQVQGPRVFTCQNNGGENNAFNLDFQIGVMGANNPQAQNFFPVLDWYPLSQEFPGVEIYPLFRSYISALDTESGEVIWEMPATPQNTAEPWITSLPALSTTNDILMYTDGSGRIQMLSTLDGSLLNSIDIETGGITAPIIEYDAVYVFSGRGSFAGTYSNSNYAAAQRLYKLTL